MSTLVLLAAGRRLLVSVVVMWAALTLLFLSLFVLPGDRVDAIVGGDRVLSPEVRDAVAKRLGLQESIAVQYGRYWKQLSTGNFGASYVSGQSVSSILERTAPASLRLAFWAGVTQLTVGATVGTLVALRRSRFFSGVATAWAVTALSAPVFVVGLALQLLLGVIPFQNGWPPWASFPVTATAQPGTWVLAVVPTGEQWRYLVLPVVTISAASAAIVSGLVVTGLRTALHSDYVRGARSRGLPERVVVTKYGMRTAMVPVLTFVGLDLAAMFGSAVVTERVFNWPGLGNQLAIGLARQDAPVLLGITAVLVVTYVAVNLVVDLLAMVLDPRLAETSR